MWLRGFLCSKGRRRGGEGIGDFGAGAYSVCCVVIG